MTHISLSELNARRAQGLSPQGGPAPRDELSKALEMPVISPLEQLTGLLGLQWNHPGDRDLTLAIFKVCGQEYSLATIHMAANYVRCIEREQSVLDRDKAAYQCLVQGIRRKA